MTSEALAVVHPISAEIEKVLLGGDLAGLTPDQRLSYYNATCKSLGLNPLTRPFDYIRLNNKLVLYAKRDATDQLRSSRGVSVVSLEHRLEDGLYIVTANVKDRAGRTDSSTGAVAIDNLRGEAKANAIMKAETKAKRRATLSICGLGLLDETEVASIPEAQEQLAAEVVTATIGNCYDCGEPVHVPLVAERSRKAFGVLVCLACGTKRAERIVIPTFDNPAAVELPQVGGTPSSTPVSGSTAAGAAPTTHEAPAAVAADKLEVLRLNLELRDGKNGPYLVYDWMKDAGNGRKNKIPVRFFRNRDNPGWYDAAFTAGPQSRLTFKIEHVTKGSTTYVNGTNLVAINGEPWPPKESLLITDSDVPF